MLCMSKDNGGYIHIGRADDYRDAKISGGVSCFLFPCVISKDSPITVMLFDWKSWVVVKKA